MLTEGHVIGDHSYDHMVHNTINDNPRYRYLIVFVQGWGGGVVVLSLKSCIKSRYTYIFIYIIILTKLDR